MRNLIIALLLLAGLQSTAQTLFTYGPHSVSKAEFWRAYTRNNTAAITETSVQEYLDLYIRFKLKVQAARDLKLDTLTSLQSDIAGFRAQMADQFMRQQGYLKELIEEAALRSQTELEVAHVFVAFGDDSVAARQKIEGAWRQLKAGAVFSATARTVSTDPYVRATDGYIGFISVFSLPYELESVVYALQPGGLSAPVKGPNGWHIFRLLQRRPTLGTLQAAHILLAVPEGASQQEIGFIQQKADSVYRQLVNGLPFAQAVEKYSDDKLTYMAGGVLPAFTFSSFDTAFSQAAFALAADGAISRPVRTRWGWHIIRRISLSTTAPNLNDATVYQQWNERVMASDRMEALARRHREEMKRASGYKPLPINEAALWQLTDSTLEAKNYAAIYRSQQQKPLFQLKEKTISVADWLRFARGKGTEKQSPAGYARLLQEFTETTVEQYYKDRLERMNDQFRFQVQEFTEGSLLFEVMERKIWSVAPADTAGLLRYFEANRSRYLWQPGVTAVIVNCADTSIANEVLRLMRANPAGWEEHMNQMGGYALADSGRFEYTQLPVREGTRLTAGTFTPIETNPNDGSSSFCYILAVHAGGDPRSFEEARGLVINDYQLQLEEQWITELKKKYPVKVNEAVRKQLLQ